MTEVTLGFSIFYKRFNLPIDLFRYVESQLGSEA